MEENHKILEDIKLKIAISSFYEEERKNMKKVRKSVLKMASVACLILVLITGVVMAKDIENFIKKLFGANTSDGVDIAVDNSYVAKIEGKKYSSEGIEIKVDSIIMDDFNFAMNFIMTLDDRYNINEFKNQELYDLKIVDETGEIVFNSHGYRFNTEKEMKEKGYGGAYSFLTEKTGEKSLKLSLAATGNSKLFPKSKFLTITFTKINTWDYNEKDEKIDKFYEGNWNFKVEVPKDFYERETFIYKAKNCNDNTIDISKITAVVTNTGCRLTVPSLGPTNKIDYKLIHDNMSNTFDRSPLQREYIQTSEGKKFEPTRKSDGDGLTSLSSDNVIDYYQTFNLTIYDATNKITVHIYTNKGEEILINLER